MLSPRSALLGVGGGLSIAMATLAPAEVALSASLEGHGTVQLATTNARVGFFETEGRIKRVYGEAFSHGATPEASAAAFVNANAALFNVSADELTLGGPFADGHHIQPIMYQPDTESYKFTGVYYRQMKNGVPVFRSRLTLLVRNEPGYPLVLASSNIRQVAGFDFNLAAAALDSGRGVASALQLSPSLTSFTDPQLVVWAGVDDMLVEPALAYSFVGDNGNPADGSPPEKYVFVADAATGAVLFMEDQIIFEDVVGNVKGMATEGVGAEHCENEVPTDLPWARVTINSTIAYADANGDFVIPWGGTSPVTVQSGLRGQWFSVSNAAGAESVISLPVTPPGPADFLHNAANTSEYYRAEVNGYLQANVVRDFTLEQNPSYPALQQTEFPVTVNRNDGYCPGNAWYDGSSINFCRAGSGYPNTAWSSVIHHEYGHHLVASGGSGQGMYGEGMSDVMGLLIMDEPGTGWGFFGPCNEPLRSADNNMQYPCGGTIHYCGQLLSGCVWSTRNELIVTNPSNYLDILSNIAVNAILLHSGTNIDPSITIDYLTLDDDDGNIGNGTPHYTEIAAGFGAHNMDAPPLELIGFEFPMGLPDLVSPAGGTVVQVAVTSIAGEPDPGTGKIHYDAGAGWITVPMTEIEPNLYEFAFPAIDCGQQVVYYFSALATSGQTQNMPAGAPDEAFSAVSAQSGEVSFSDNFESNLGWTTSGNAADGQWNRGIPIDCDRGDPPTDADGSSQCALTDNSAANNCNSDVDDGTTYLTSPILDATGDGAVISYWRWYSNTYGSDPMNDIFKVEVSDNGGSTWTTLESVGPGGPQVDGGWFHVSFRIDDFVGLTDQFRIRFAASDLNSGSVVEAGVDGVQLTRFSCSGNCPADVNGDNIVDVLDLLSVLAAWGATGGSEDVNGDGVVNVLDLLEVLSAWGPC